MEKFDKIQYGYDPNQVNKVLDEIITQVELLAKSLMNRERELVLLKQKMQNENELYKDITDKLEEFKKKELEINQKMDYYKMLETKVIEIEEAYSSYLKNNDKLVTNAKKDASKIIDEAKKKAEDITSKVNQINSNISKLKDRLKTMINEQLSLVENIGKVE